MCPPLKVHLQGDVRCRTEGQRDHQPQNLLLEEAQYVGSLEGVVQAGAGDQEDQRHEPVAQEPDPDIDAVILHRVLDVPAPGVKEARHVEDEDGQDGEDARGVEGVVASSRLRVHRVSP
jgi:hypothetical protein